LEKTKSLFAFFEQSRFSGAFFPVEKAPNQMAFVYQKTEKKISNDFIWTFYFWYKVIFWDIFRCISEKMTFFGKVRIAV
jgi:hypothetical protein